MPYLKMLQQALSLSFPIISLMFSVVSASGANTYIYVQCSQLYFASMTPYESNINSLFTSLVDSASVSNFNKFEVSLPGSSQNDVAYGLFQCRGNLINSKCKDCVANAASQLRTTCHLSIGGTMQLEGCFVKYDNASFFGVEDKMEVLKKCGPSIGYNPDVSSNVDDTLAHLIATGNGQYFRMGDFGSIRGVAQCVEDLSVSDCQDCLSEASGRLRSECETSSWGDLYLGKCYIRYADHGNSKHNCNNCDDHNGNELRANIIVQAIGNAIGGVVTAIVSAGLSYVISSKVAKARVEEGTILTTVPGLFVVII